MLRLLLVALLVPSARSTISDASRLESVEATMKSLATTVAAQEAVIATLLDTVAMQGKLIERLTGRSAPTGLVQTHDPRLRTIPDDTPGDPLERCVHASETRFVCNHLITYPALRLQRAAPGDWNRWRRG